MGFLELVEFPDIFVVFALGSCLRGVVRFIV